jgi:DNA-binding transcriptional ArsR family regulator
LEITKDGRGDAGGMTTDVAIGALAALAHETRLNIFRLLVRAGTDGLAAGAVGEALGLPSATLSFHLKELKVAGVVRCRRQGRSLIYSPSFEMMNELLGFLTENCCQGAAGCNRRPRGRARARARA